MTKTYYIQRKSIDVKPQDQTTRPIDFYFVNVLDPVPKVLTTNTTPGSYIISLNNVTGIVVGSFLGMFQDSMNPSYYFGTVLAINGNDLTMDNPMDQVFITSLAVLFRITRELNVNGSVTPVTFLIDNEADLPFDINELHIQMITASATPLIKFGDLTALTRGLVLRKKLKDGSYWNLWNIKDNRGFSQYCSDYQTFTATNPSQDAYGLAAEYILNGLPYHGVVIRLEKGEHLELIVQDNLTGLSSFRVLAVGQYTDPN